MSWKDVAINEFSDRYEVSDTGNIRNKETGQVLKPHLNSKTGYLQVMLTIKNKRQNVNVHRLVLSSFKPTNNASLEWVTSKQNINWGQHTKNQKETLILDKPEKTAITVVITRDDGAQVKVSSVRQAALWTKIPRSRVRKLLDTGNVINGYQFSTRL